MMDMSNLDLSRPVFVCEGQNSGDLMMLQFIHEVFVYVRQCLLDAGLEADVLCKDLGYEWRDYQRDYQRDYLDLEQENEQPMTPHARRNNLIRLAMIAELLSNKNIKNIKKDWMSCGYFGTGYLDLGAFAGVLGDIYGSTGDVVDPSLMVQSLVTPGFIEEVKAAFGQGIFNIPQADVTVQARVWQILFYLGNNVDTHLPETPDLMFALLKHFVSSGPHSDYPGLKKHYCCNMVVDFTPTDVLNTLYTRYCIMSVMKYVDTAPARGRLAEMLVKQEGDALSSPYIEGVEGKKIKFYGSEETPPEMIARNLIYLLSASNAKYPASFKNDILASQGWLLCRLFAHKYPDDRVKTN